MAELINKKYDKRVIFPRDKQEKFLLMARESLRISWSVFADRIGVHGRTLNDWKRGAYSMPLNVLKKICKMTKIEEPTDIEIKDPFWYVFKGARAGWLAVYKKYGAVGGDPEYRKKKWREWWEREGKYTSPLTAIKLIREPNFSQELAEFTGIVLGDGSITQRQVVITLHYKDDKEYGKFVVSLIKRLFDVPVGICYRSKESVIKYIVSRIKLVHFCVDKLGLKRGNKVKQQVDIPDWIKDNNSYSIACVRGLIDTDGCIFTHRYKVNGKIYKYKKLAFTSLSNPLRQSVFNIMKRNGLNPRFAQEKDVRIDSISDMEKYFNFFNSHNPKHLRRYNT